MNSTRPAAVAGTFYPGDQQELNRLIAGFINAVDHPQRAAPPKCLIVPHAGYIYSGSTAAYAYRLLQPHAAAITRVILLGPPHRVPVRGIAIPTWRHFATPLGEVELDQPALTELEQFNFVSRSNAAHEFEHSLEVQLPFLKSLLDDFTLVPMVVGECAPEQVADVIDSLWGGDETLLICSTDLSHFHPYQSAREIDLATCELIKAEQPTIEGEQACGCRALNGMLVAARRHGLPVAQLHYCNSGDTAGPKDSVVGYGAFSIG